MGKKQNINSLNNLKEWNRLQKTYGRKEAQIIAKRRRVLKKSVEYLKTSRFIAKRGQAAHDLYSMIMESIESENKDNIRLGYDSEDILEVGYQMLTELKDGEQLTEAQATELLDAWQEWLAL